MEDSFNDFASFIKHNLIDIDEKSSSASNSLRLEANVLLRGKNHNRTVLKEILTHYSKSIAYALPGSEELALGHNNRSVLMHHIKKYDLALVDIEEALNITSSAPLKSKLLIRKISCLKAMGKKMEPLLIRTIENLIGQITTDKIKEQFQNMFKKALEVQIDACFSAFVPTPIPEMIRSREIPCASDAVELNYNETFGRHLKANRFIPPGEILIVEDAYVKFPSYEDRYLICSNCLDNTFTAIPCESCPCIVYCSKSCKIDAWTRYHKVECSILQLLSKKMLDTMILRFLRSVIIALNEKNFQLDLDYGIDENKYVETCSSDKRTKGFFEGQFLSNKLRCFCSLEDHKEVLENRFVENLRMSTAIETSALIIMHLLKPALLANINESDQKIFDQSRKWYALKELVEKIIRITKINAIKNQQIRRFSEEPDKTNIFNDFCGDLGSNTAICCSLINHSCSPNVGRLFRNGKCIIFSLQPIKTDEQIFITYCHKIDDKTVERQHYLRDTYYFDCNCLACKLNIWVDPKQVEDQQRQLFKTEPKDLQNFYKSLTSEKLSLLFDDNLSNTSTINKKKNMWTEYMKWKISQIFQKKQLTDALVESCAYEKVLQEFYHEIYVSSKLLIERCC